MKNIIKIASVLLIVFSCTTLFAQDPPPPNGGGAPSGGNTPVSTPIGSLGIILFGGGAFLLALKQKKEE